MNKILGTSDRSKEFYKLVMIPLIKNKFDLHSIVSYSGVNYTHQSLESFDFTKINRFKALMRIENKTGLNFPVIVSKYQVDPNYFKSEKPFDSCQIIHVPVFNSVFGDKEMQDVLQEYNDNPKIVLDYLEEIKDPLFDNLSICFKVKLVNSLFNNNEYRECESLIKEILGIEESKENCISKDIPVKIYISLW